MSTFRTLRRVLEDLEDRGVNSDDVVVDPKSVHVVSDDDEAEHTED
jgi:hypothetical protein